MKDNVDKFARVFGTCVILVSLCSGCATGTPSAQAMSYEDINNFRVDCRIADQQRLMLLSMKRTRDERAWDKITGAGDANFLINFHLHNLRYC